MTEHPLPLQQAAPHAAWPQATSADLSSSSYWVKERWLVLNYFWVGIIEQWTYFLALLWEENPHWQGQAKLFRTSQSMVPHQAPAAVCYPLHKETTRTYSATESSYLQLLTGMKQLYLAP